MIEFKTYCLYCKGLPSPETYTCDCMKEKWAARYRVAGVKLQGGGWQEDLNKSFHEYDLQGGEGILQYKGIPFIEKRKELIARVGCTDLIEFPTEYTDSRLQIYLKDEGNNPSGCFKDRETVACLLHLLALKKRKATIFSSGNAAASAALLCQDQDIDLIAVVPGDTYEDKIEYIRAHGASVIKMGDASCAFEEGYERYAELASSGFFHRHGFDDWSVRNPFRVEGDKTIALEIIQQFQKKRNGLKTPDFVVVPTANGSCLAGIWKGFLELKEALVIEELPKMVSVGIRKGSPVYKAVQEGIDERPATRSLEGISSEDADIGSIILAEEGYDSINAAEAVKASGGFALEMTAAQIREKLNQMLDHDDLLMKRHDLLPEPASILSILAAEQLSENFDEAGPHSVISIITGHGMKSRNKISEIVEDAQNMKHIVQPIILRKKARTPDPVDEKATILETGTQLDDLRTAFEKLIA